MSSAPETESRWLPPVVAAVRLIIISIAVLSVILKVALELELSEAQANSWILAAYGLPGLVSLALAILYRQPLMLTGNLFAIIFIDSLGNQLSYPELVGAYIVAGASVLLISALGLTGRLATWIPSPVVSGLLAGAIIPFVADLFTSLGNAPVLVGGIFLAYLLGGLLPDSRLPPILLALVAGVFIAAVTGQFGAPPGSFSLPIPAITAPVFSLPAIATATPVLVVLITIQSNLPSVVFLQSQGYRPPERVIDTVSGIWTSVGSLLGPMAMSVSLPATALIGGTEAGARQDRHRAVYVAAGAAVLVALLAGIATDLPEIIPLPFLLALAGLATVGVLTDALQQITRGPLLLGPVFAFAISLSEISLLGFGPFFWALVLGTVTSWLLERDELRRLGDEEAGLTSP